MLLLVAVLLAAFRSAVFCMLLVEGFIATGSLIVHPRCRTPECFAADRTLLFDLTDLASKIHRLFNYPFFLLRHSCFHHFTYENRNALREAFDKEKVQGMTFARWAEIYLNQYVNTKRSKREDVRHLKTLSDFFGSLLLSQLARAKEEEFKQIRKARNKVREGWDYKRIMAITGHKTFAVFQRYNNPSEEDLQEVVAGTPQRVLHKHSR